MTLTAKSHLYSRRHFEPSSLFAEGIYLRPPYRNYRYPKVAYGSGNCRQTLSYRLKKEVKTIAKQDLFINDEIRVREVRLIGLEGEQLGIKPLSEAQALADDANVDLVLIQPQAKPPVAKIMDYGKFKFEYQKKQKEQRKKQSVVTVKEVR